MEKRTTAEMQPSDTTLIKIDSQSDIVIPKNNDYYGSQNQLLAHHLTELIKMDGYSNILTGYGTYVDRKKQFDFIPETRLSLNTRQAMARGSGASRVIISELVKDAMKLPLKIENDRLDDIIAQFESYDLLKQVMRTALSSRQNGAAALLWQINDGQSFDMPIDYERIKDIQPLLIVSKDNLMPLSLDPVIKDRPAQYWIQGTQPEYYYTYHESLPKNLFHKSRIMIFEGEYCQEENLINNNSFPESVLDLNKEAILLYELVVGSISTLADSAIQEIIGLEGLNEDLDGDRDDKILKKLQLIFQGKSIVKRIAMDKNDTYQYHSANFTGYRDLESIAKSFISLNSRIPITKFFGESPSASIGSQAGSYEETLWYARVESYQTEQLKPNFDKFFRWIQALLKIKEPIKYSFAKLKTVDAKTESEINKNDSQTLISLMDKGVFTLDEVRNIFVKRYAING